MLKGLRRALAMTGGLNMPPIGSSACAKCLRCRPDQSSFGALVSNLHRAISPGSKFWLATLSLPSWFHRPSWIFSMSEAGPKPVAALVIRCRHVGRVCMCVHAVGLLSAQCWVAMPRCHDAGVESARRGSRFLQDKDAVSHSAGCLLLAALVGSLRGWRCERFQLQ